MYVTGDMCGLNWISLDKGRLHNMHSLLYDNIYILLIQACLVLLKLPVGLLNRLCNALARVVYTFVTKH